MDEEVSKYRMQGDLENLARSSPKIAKKLLANYQIRYPKDTWVKGYINRNSEYWQSLEIEEC